MKRNYTTWAVILIILALFVWYGASKTKPPTGVQIELTPAAGTQYPVMSSTTPTITMKIGDRIMEGQDLLTPTAVIEDNRCATGLTCVQAGTVVLAMNISSPDEVTTMNLEIGKPITMDGFTMTLDSVTPYPSAQQKIATSDYSFTLTIVAASPTTPDTTIPATSTPATSPQIE